jgi:hypothetical protein
MFVSSLYSQINFNTTLLDVVVTTDFVLATGAIKQGLEERASLSPCKTADVEKEKKQRNHARQSPKPRRHCKEGDP